MLRPRGGQKGGARSPSTSSQSFRRPCNLRALSRTSRAVLPRGVTESRSGLKGPETLGTVFTPRVLGRRAVATNFVVPVPTPGRIIVGSDPVRTGADLAITN